MYFSNTRAAVSLALLLASHLTPAQVPNITAQALREDYTVLKKLLEQLHPGLYWYNTPAEWEQHWTGLAKAWDKDCTLGEAYLSLSEFLNKIQCGHSYTNFYNQPKAVKDALFNNRDKVPFYFRWIDGAMVVTEDYSKSKSFPRGSIILSINGHTPELIRKNLLKIARADGANLGKRMAYLEVQPGDEFAAFDIFLPLYFPNPKAEFEIWYLKPGNRGTSQVVTPAITAADRQSPATKQMRPDPNAPMWKLEKLDSKTAYLRMDSWAVFNSKWDWKGFLKQTMDSLSLQQVPHLIIDIRRNEGGLSCGDEILSRLTSKELTVEGFDRFTRYQKVPDDLRRYIDTWDNSFYDWGKQATPLDNGMFRLKRFGDTENFIIKPSGTTYKGKVYVLVGPTNSSATSLFAAAVKRAKLGTLIGQTTGGNQRGINGSGFFFATLPNSRIELDIPLIAVRSKQSRPNAGIDPDIFVKTTAQDIGVNRDPEMETVMRMIQGVRSTSKQTEPLSDW